MADTIRNIIQEVVGSYLDHFCVYPASIKMEFHKRQAGKLIRYSISTSGSVTRIGGKDTAGQDCDVSSIYQCMGQLVGKIDEGNHSLTLTFENEIAILLVDNESIDDYSFVIERIDPKSTNAETFLLD